MTGSLSVPSGDPAAIRQQTAQLRTAAQRSANLSSDTSKVTSTVLDAGQWKGEGADSFESAGQSVARAADVAQQPALDVADIMDNWANRLESVQGVVQAATSLSQAAATAPSLAPQATLAQQQAMGEVSALQSYGDQLAGQISSAMGGWQTGNMYGRSSPLATWINSQSGMSLPPDLGTGTIKDPIPEPFDGTIKDPIPEPFDGTIKDPIPEPFDGTIIDPIPEDLPGLIFNANTSNPNPNPTPTTGPLAGGILWQGGSGGGRSGNNFPVQGGPADGVLYRQNPQTGQINGYAVYDSQGNIIKRVDLTGRAHGGVPTPHVLEYDQNTNPETGQTFVKPQKTVRPATPEEIP